MAEYTHLERALRILQRLMTYDRVSVRDLHEMFERRDSVRTIQRALTALQEAHVPLRIERGAHGEKYYTLVRPFDYVPLQLSGDELLAAMLLSQFSEYFSGSKIGEDIRRVVEKLDQLIPAGGVAVSRALEGLPETFHFHEPGRMNVRPCGETLRLIFRALLERRVCSIRYGRSGKTFDVHPYSLLLHNGILYAVAFQPRHQDWIYLSIPRIEAVSLQDETFRRNGNFHLQEFLRDRFGLWSGPPARVQIRFHKTVVPSLADRLWHASQEFELLKNGDALLTMHVGVSSELVAWVLRWQHYAVVLEPAALRDQVRESLRQMQELYQ